MPALTLEQCSLYAGACLFGDVYLEWAAGLYEASVDAARAFSSGVGTGGSEAVWVGGEVGGWWVRL